MRILEPIMTILIIGLLMSCLCGACMSALSAARSVTDRLMQVHDAVDLMAETADIAASQTDYNQYFTDFDSIP